MADMFFFGLKLISRHPKKIIGGKTYLKLSGVCALRFELNSPATPKSIRLKVNNRHLTQEDLVAGHNLDFSGSSYFINLWFNLSGLENQEAELAVELSYFGLFIQLSRLNIFVSEPVANHFTLGSDSFLDDVKNESTRLQGHQLIEKINHQPSVVRSTCSHDLEKQVKKILILRLDQMGDFVLTVSAIAELKKLFPEADISVIVSPSNAPLARALDFFSEVIVLPFSFVEKTNFRELSDEAKNKVREFSLTHKFDLALDLSPMPETRVLLSLVDADYKVGFENVESSMLDLGVLIHSKDPINALSNVSHAAYPMLLVDAVRHALKPVFFHAPLIKEKRACLSNFGLEDRDYVVVHSGARNLLVRWPQENFVALALRIVTLGIPVVFFSDDPIPAELKEILSKTEKISVAEGPMEFGTFDALLSFAKIFIGNDTGPKHLAAMRGTPVISVHSPRTNWSEWGQVDSGVVISRRVPCAGCAIVTKAECGRDLACLKQIKVDEIFDCYLALSSSPSR